MIGKYPAKLDDKNRLFVPSKLRSELGEDLYLTGIGWIDDQLHVQICINGLKSSSFNFSETVEGEGWTGNNREVSYSPLNWYEDGNDYLEYVFDYKPGDEKTITLNLDITIAQEIITGPWEFRFQLGMICPDVKEAEPAAE